MSAVPGCGAIMHGARQNIDVQSSPSGAKVETSPSTGTFTTPTVLDLERKNSYVLTFTSPGYTPATFNIHNSVGTGTVIADVLLTGLVGVVVDGLTGSWYGLSPESANTTLTRVTGQGPSEIRVYVSKSKDGAIEIKSDGGPVEVTVGKK
jgi:hypothetical protein